MTPEDRLISHKLGDPVTEQDLIDALTIARKLGEDLIEARAEVEQMKAEAADYTLMAEQELGALRAEVERIRDAYDAAMEPWANVEVQTMCIPVDRWNALVTAIRGSEKEHSHE